MSLNFQGFLQALPILGVGMAGTFLVTGLIILAVVVLNRLTAPREQKTDT